MHETGETRRAAGRSQDTNERAKQARERAGYSRHPETLRVWRQDVLQALNPLLTCPARRAPSPAVQRKSLPPPPTQLPTQATQDVTPAQLRNPARRPMLRHLADLVRSSLTALH